MRSQSVPSARAGRVFLGGLGGSAAAAAVTFALLHWMRPDGRGDVASPEELISAGLVWAAVALCAWLGVGSLLVGGAALPGAVGSACAALARRLTPRLLRQTLTATIGTAVATLSLPVGPAHGAGVVQDVGSVGSGGSAAGTSDADAEGRPASPLDGTTAPATAAPPRAPSPALGATSPSDVPGVHTANTRPPAPSLGSAAPDPGWRPSAPVKVVDPDESRLLAQPPRRVTPSEATITVHRGDTLWHIAARHLGPGASDAEIAMEWPRWYAANSAVIGADPDRLLPGQELVPPPTGEQR